MATQGEVLHGPLRLRILATDPTDTPTGYIDTYAIGSAVFQRTQGGTVTDLSAGGAATESGEMKYLKRQTFR